MLKTPLSTVIGGAFWTPSATIVGSASRTLNQIIKSLFANGEQGFAYDPNDLTTMFQDAAGTIPVTGAGQPVGRVLDKSGRGNHATQSTSAARPILRKNATTGAYYLEFDGTDDFLQTANIDFTSTDKVSLFTGVRKLSDAARAILSELSGGGGYGSFRIEAPVGTFGNYNYTSVGSITVAANSALAYTAPNSAVLSSQSNISGDFVVLRVNGSISGQSTADQGTGNYGSYPLYIGRRGGTSLPFNGHLYGLIGIGRLTTDSETTALEKELAKRTGVTLSV